MALWPHLLLLPKQLVAAPVVQHVTLYTAQVPVVLQLPCGCRRLLLRETAKEQLVDGCSATTLLLLRGCYPWKEARQGEEDGVGLGDAGMERYILLGVWEGGREGGLRRAA